MCDPVRRPVRRDMSTGAPARAASTVVPRGLPRRCPAAITPRALRMACPPVKLIVSSARPMPHEETKALAISRHWPPPLAARR